MADLKINQLDPIIYVSSGSGAAFNALSDADLFIVKMKVRGTAIGDEDRKLTWLELRNSLNLGQYMPTVGGNFTGDITLNNGKSVKAQQVGAGADIALLTVDSSNRVNIGSTTNLTRIYSSSIPQLVDGTGNYNFITAKNLPAPADINAYNKMEVDNRLATKFDKAGGDVSGDINLTQNATRLYGFTTDGLKASLAYVTAGNTVNFGHSTLHTNLVSTDVPGWTNGSQTYDIITRANLPAPGEINAYSKTEVDAIAAQKLNLSGGELTGHLTVGLNKAILVRESDNVSRVGLSAVPALSSLQIGDPGSSLTVKIKSAGNPTVSVGSGPEQTIYHSGNKPSASDLGFDTLLNTKMDKVGGTFTGTVTLNNGVHLLSVSGSGAVTPNSPVDIVYSGPDGLYIGDVKQKTTIVGNGNLIYNNGTPYNVYHTGYKPSATDVGAYSKSESDGLYARKGVNTDITALNALTGALKVGANAVQDLEVTTLQQVRALTSGTAGAVVGVVGGFIGAIQWYSGSRSSIPAGWLAADGQTLNRTDYPDLWSSVNGGSFTMVSEALWQASGQAYGTEYRGMFSSGNGSSTFRLPDMNGAQSGSLTHLYQTALVPGSSNQPGFVAPSGAPAITGTFTSDDWGAQQSPTGAFTNSGQRSFAANTTSPAIVGQEYDMTFDASRSSPLYGRSPNEIVPNTVYGTWIIRVSNNFAAANTQFTVYNGAATLPASGTVTNGGYLGSSYSVNGVQDHALSLSSQRNVGALSSAALNVVSQAQGSMAFTSYKYLFTADGRFTAKDISVVDGPIRVKNTANDEVNFAISGSSLVMNKTSSILSWSASALLLYNVNGIQSLNNISAKGGVSCYTQTAGIVNQGGPTLASSIRDGGVPEGRVRANFDFWVRGSDQGQRQGVIRVHGDDMGQEQNWLFNGSGTDSGRITGSAGKVALDPSSDAILKNIVGDMDLEAAAQRVDRMKFRDYHWNDHEYNQQRGVDMDAVQHGQIAQELEKIDARYVSKHKQPIGQMSENRSIEIRTLNNEALLMDALATIQLLRKEVASLKSAQG